ncbi:hypothetical protein ACFV2N_45245 [Streptomyces sp. NPDC059680]|uniref:hypothetical protein n=1 Tax=Streptomyces sp. NPDC059680 TaxID=3346904 RepID=UPI0036AE1D83
MRRRMLISATATAIAVTTTLLTTTTAGAVEQSKADKDYCTKQGGMYDTFVPLAEGQEMGGSEGLCVFWDTAHKTKISVTAEALNADKPTLAELAYNHPPKPNPRPVGVAMGNPGDAYCYQLGGTLNFNGPVGYWVIKGQEHSPKFENTTDLCVFADMSAMDSWGLLYHAGGVVRGQDLTHKWRASRRCEPEVTEDSDATEPPVVDPGVEPPVIGPGGEMPYYRDEDVAVTEDDE